MPLETGTRNKGTFGPHTTHRKMMGFFFALKIWVITPRNEGNVGFHGSVCVFSLEIMPALKRKTNGGNKKVSTRLATLWWEGEALCEFYLRLHEWRNVAQMLFKKNSNGTVVQ